MPMNNKNKYGQYFTKKVIADFMVSLIRHSHTSRVLEPSCGQGVFLNSLTEQAFTHLTAYEIDATLSVGDSRVRHQSFISSPLHETFDVIIGNPPYIRWKNLEEELKNELTGNRLWNKYFNSLCDYLFIFILKSVEQLNDNGELLFICPEYWINTTHAQSLRDYLCANGHFTDIYQFKEAPLFEKVTSSFIIFRYVKNAERPKNISLYRYTGKGLPDSRVLRARSCFSKADIPSFKPGRRWLLASGKTQTELSRFEDSCRKPGLFGNDFFRIGDVCDIGNGMVSGMDAAFRIDNYDALNEKERDAVIRVLKAKSLRPYNHEEYTYYIYIREDGLSEEQFKTQYPHFHARLKPFEAQLDKRYRYNREIPYWEFVFHRNRQLFERNEQRIFIPCKERVSHKDFFRFCLAPAGVYPLQDVTGILKKKQCKESVEYLLAFLNNKRVFDWLYLNGIVKGEVVEFSEAPIASIPYRPIDWENPEEVMLHGRITEAVRQLTQHKNEPDNISILHYAFDQLLNERP